MDAEALRIQNAEYQRRKSAKDRGVSYIPLPVTEDDLARKNPLDYLKLDPEQAQKSDELGFAIDKVKSRLVCEVSPNLWAFDPDGDIPSAETAKAFCYGCPVVEQCAAYAVSLKSKQVSGIWGGRVFVYGEELIA